MDTSIISARGSPRNAGPRGATASPISRFLGSVHVKPTRTRQLSGLRIEVGDQQGTRISDRNLEAKGCRLSPASASAIGEMARGKDPRPGLAGAQSTPTGADVRAGGPGHGVPPLQDLSIEFSISTCPLSSSASLFPDPASIRARPCSACPRVRRWRPVMTADGQVQCNLKTSAALDIEHGICPPAHHPSSPSPSAPACPTAHLNKWALAVQGVLAPANAEGIHRNVVGTEQKHNAHAAPSSRQWSREN